MTQRDIAARADNFVVGVIAAVFLVSLLAHSQRQDDTDDAEARLHAEQQTKAAAQPDTWAGLDRDGRRIAYVGIKK